MKRRILCAAFALVGLVGCRNDPDPPREPEVTLSRIAITGIPGGTAVLTVVLDYGTPKSRGLAAADGTLVGKDGTSHAVAEIGSDGTALTNLYYGADAMHFLFALLGYGSPIGMDPPIAVPNLTSSVVSGRGDVVVNYSDRLETLLSADTGTRTWRNIRFADFTANRVLTLDWNAGDS